MDAPVLSRQHREQLQDQYFQEEEMKIRRIQDGLELCDILTDNMMNVLDSFEEKLKALNATIDPIHRKTQNLTVAQRNIDNTLAGVSTVIKHAQVSNDAETSISRRKLTPQNYVDYVQCVGEVNKAITFFQENQNFRSADKAIRRLKEALRRAMERCADEFRRSLQEHANGVDVTKLGWPLPSKFELVPTSTVTRLASIAGCMGSCTSFSFLDLITELRGSAIKSSLKKVMSERTQQKSKAKQKKNKHKGKSSRDTLGLTRGLLQDNDDEKDVDGATFLSPFAPPSSGAQQVGRYERGSHKTIFHLEFFAWLLEEEYRLLASMVAETTMTANDVHKTFIDTVTSPMEYFIRKSESVVKSKDSNKVLIVLDILSHFSRKEADFRRLLCGTFPSNALFSQMLQLKEDLVVAFRKALISYRDYILQFSPKTQSASAKQLSKDGTVYTLTIETLTFLKRLTEYSPTVQAIRHQLDDFADHLAGKRTMTDKEVEALDRGLFSAAPTGVDDEKTNTKPSTMGTIIWVLLVALEHNLESKARSYKLPSLAAIFLLNNYVYISDTVRKTHLASLLGLGVHFNERYDKLIAKATQTYTEASWTKLEKLLSLDDREAILAKYSKGGARKAIKAKFADFNKCFETIYNTQRKFSVPARDFRSQLRNNNVDRIVPLYKEFYATFANLDFSTHKSSYCKYDPSTLESMMNKFFEDD